MVAFCSQPNLDWMSLRVTSCCPLHLFCQAHPRLAVRRLQFHPTLSSFYYLVPYVSYRPGYSPRTLVALPLRSVAETLATKDRSCPTLCFVDFRQTSQGLAGTQGVPSHSITRSLEAHL